MSAITYRYEDLSYHPAIKFILVSTIGAMRQINRHACLDHGGRHLSLGRDAKGSSTINRRVEPVLEL